MINRIRQQFPALQQRVQGHPLTYLDSAATTQKPASVITTIQHYYRRDNANVHRGSYQLASLATAKFEQARAKVAHYFHAKPNQLIWTKGCTEAINLVAQSWAWEMLQPDDTILVSGLEHHANLIPWQQLCRKLGCTLLICPVNPQGELDLEAYLSLLEHQPKLVALTHVSNVLGSLNPISQMITQAHAVGAKVLVDGAQAAAHLEVDFNALDADFYTFSGHKMYGPTGIGGLLAKSELLEQFEPWQTGGEMVDEVSYESASWADLPARLEPGTPHIAGVIGLAQAVDFLHQLPDGWRADEANLLAYAKSQLESLPFIQLVGTPSEQVAVQSFVSTQMASADLAAYLDQCGIALRLGRHCAHPLLAHLGFESTLRLSIGCYTDTSDIDRLVEALKQAHRADMETSLQAEASAESPQQLADALQQVHDWQSRFALLIRLGRAIPDAELAKRQASDWVKGCESQTWLALSPAQGRWHCRINSDAQLLKGVLFLLAEAFNELSYEQQQRFDGVAWLEQSGLTGQLSTTRNLGMQAVIAQLKERALQPL